MRLLKLFFADRSSEAAYQASLVTRDRALTAQQESIDLMKRLIAQMEDDPLMTKARESLEEILENPDVITDEVFNNIMSKTQEVLNANYESQVDQFLDSARGRGVSGDTLAIQLSKAKNARAQGMAAAYRDAIIARSKEGLTTSMEAINTAFSQLNNFFQNKRIATEDLVNIHQSVVPETFRNYGPPSQATPSGVGGAGGGAGAGERTEIPIDPNVQRTLGQDQEANELFEKYKRDAIGGTGGDSSVGLPTMSNAEKFGGTPEEIAAQFGRGLDPSAIATGPGDGSGQEAALAEERRLRIEKGLPAEPVSGQDQLLSAQIADLKSSIPKGGADLGALQASIKDTFSGAVGDPTGKITDYNSTSSPYGSYTPSPTREGAVPGVKQTNYGITPTGQNYGSSATRGISAPETTLAGQGLGGSGVTMAGGAVEAKRVADMIGTRNNQTGGVITPEQIIGTTAGGGVRKDALSYNQQKAAEQNKGPGFYTTMYRSGDTGRKEDVIAIGQKWNSTAGLDEAEAARLQEATGGTAKAQPTKKSNSTKSSLLKKALGFAMGGFAGMGGAR